MFLGVKYRQIKQQHNTMMQAMTTITSALYWSDKYDGTSNLRFARVDYISTSTDIRNKLKKINFMNF